MSFTSANRLNAHAEHLLVDVPKGFCENYALTTNDPHSGLHLLACWGSQPFDHGLWHEMLQLRLPGERTLVWKSAGRGSAPTGPGGAVTEWRCEAPGLRWHLRMAAFGQIVPTGSLESGPVPDGPWVRTAIDLTFDAVGPAWVLSADTLEHAQDTSAFHYEQPGTVHGAVTVGEQHYGFSGTGHRDHSRGPRDFASVHDHAWVDCAFPDGRFFAVYRMRLAGAVHGVSAGCVGDAETVTPASTVAIPVLAEDPSSTYTIVIDTDAGRHEIAAEIVAPLGTTTYVTPNYMVLGRAQLPEATQHVSDALTRFVWDGEVGFGHTQRSTSARG